MSYEIHVQPLTFIVRGYDSKAGESSEEKTPYSLVMTLVDEGMGDCRCFAAHGEFPMSAMRAVIRKLRSMASSEHALSV